MSDFQANFEYNIKNHKTVTKISLIRNYVTKIENRITSKIKTGYYHERLTPETMNLPESNKSNITKNENGENVPHLWITKVVLISCNNVNVDYQHDSRVLHTRITNTFFGLVLDISFKILYFKIFPYIFGLMIKFPNL